MTVRAVCTDIDGTLLNSSRELSERTISAIKKISHTIPVILASSRMPSAMRHLQKQLDILHQPIIAYNGGYVIQYQNGSPNPYVYDSVFISAEICSSILNLAKETAINVSLYFEDEWYAPSPDYWTEREEKITKVKAIIKDPAAVIAQWKTSGSGAHKVMCMGPEAEIDQLNKQLLMQFESHINVYRSRPTYIEIAAKSISKATALELILKTQFSLGLEDVMSFGDNYNDIDMLKASGLGIAVDNAVPEAKAVAKEITSKSIEDGVAISIEKYCF
jgi:hypothetical protein